MEKDFGEKFGACFTDGQKRFPLSIHRSLVASLRRKQVHPPLMAGIKFSIGGQISFDVFPKVSPQLSGVLGPTFALLLPGLGQNAVSVVLRREPIRRDPLLRRQGERSRDPSA